MIHKATDDAVTATEKIGNDAELATARDALRSLLRVVPHGVARDHLVYARVCLVRNDLKGAHESVLRRRDNMREIGLLPATVAVRVSVLVVALPALGEGKPVEGRVAVAARHLNETLHQLVRPIIDVRPGFRASAPRQVGEMVNQRASGALPDSLGHARYQPR